MSLRWVLLVAVFGLLACQGADGPTGPRGAQGPRGPAGHGTRVTLTALVDTSGSASVTLPAAAGTDPDAPPLVTCHLRAPQSTTWLPITDGYSASAPYCQLSIVSGGPFTAALHRAPAGWTAAFVLLY